MNVLNIESIGNKDGDVIPFCTTIILNKSKETFYGLDCMNLIFEYIFSLNFNEKTIYTYNLDFNGFLIIEHFSDKKDYSIELFSQNMSIYFIKLKKKSKSVIIKCLYKLLPLTFERMVKIFKFEKKINFPYRFVTKEMVLLERLSPKKEILNTDFEYNYLSSNVKDFSLKKLAIANSIENALITKEVLLCLEKIAKEFKISLKSVNSAPSLALKIFSKNFNKNIIKTSYNVSYENLARKSYFGGRCEVYGNSKTEENVFHFDFSGMYAQCMLQKFPFGNHFIDNKCNCIDKPGIY